LRQAQVGVAEAAVHLNGQGIAGGGVRGERVVEHQVEQRLVGEAPRRARARCPPPPHRV
jgi:hypothetical protein